jgi:uncharacterized membrane protein YfcA
MLGSVLFTLTAGATAGMLGALLGIGGGVFLVPLLNLVLHLPMRAAIGISLITVIATSSVVSAKPGRLQVANLRLGMVLEIFTTAGAAVAGLFAHSIPTQVLQWLFGGSMVGVALVMAGRLGRRSVVVDPAGDLGVLGGRYHDFETGGDVAYRVERQPVAFGMSFVAGMMSTLVGIGGGVVKVPALNAWCGVPLRAAAATSALMIGATAAAGVVPYLIRGDVMPDLAASTVLGVLAGSRLGFYIGDRSRARGLELLMAVVLVVVGVVYFVKAGQ